MSLSRRDTASGRCERSDLLLGSEVEGGEPRADGQVGRVEAGGGIGPPSPRPSTSREVKPCSTAMRANACVVRNLAFTKYAHWIRKWANGQDTFRAVHSMSAFERGHLCGVRSWYRRSDLFVECLISGFTPDWLKIWILSRPFRQTRI